MKHFVICYDKNDGLSQLHVLNSEADSIAVYNYLQHTIEGADYLEAVMLSAEKFSDILRTHSRYFFTMDELISKLEDLLK